MLQQLLIGLAFAVVVIQSAEFGFLRLEIKPAQYESILKYVDADPGDVDFRSLVAHSMTDGRIRSHEFQEIVHYILRRDGLYRYSVPSGTPIVEARQILHDRVW